MRRLHESDSGSAGERKEMLFKSDNRRISMLAVIGLAASGLLPASLMAVEVKEPFQIQQEGTQLIGRMEVAARDIHHNAGQLDSFTRTGQVSTSTHKDHLMLIKSLVNDGLRPTLERLAEIRQDLPSW